MSPCQIPEIRNNGPHRSHPIVSRRSDSFSSITTPRVGYRAFAGVLDRLEIRRRVFSITFQFHYHYLPRSIEREDIEPFPRILEVGVLRNDDRQVLAEDTGFLDGLLYEICSLEDH